jgi:DNA-binding transcriptional ArsR family regulator
VPEIPDEDVVELTDPRAIRAIAHPARLLVIEAFYDEGRELTATQAAELAGTTPSAMSYHLRALERYGIVRRAPAARDARERPWTRVGKDLQLRLPGHATSRAVTMATTAVMGTAMDLARDGLLAALDRATSATGRPSDRVASFTHNALRVTPEEARVLLDELRARIEPLREEQRRDAPQDASRLSLVIVSFPDPDPARPRAAGGASRTDERS